MPDRQLFLKAATTTQYVSRIVERQLEPVGVPAYLLALLTHIRDHAPVSPSTISAASGVPMTTLRDNIQRLLDRRLVRKSAHPTDGRSYLLSLTARGKALAAAADPALLGPTWPSSDGSLGRSATTAVLDELNEALEAWRRSLRPRRTRRLSGESRAVYEKALRRNRSQKGHRTGSATRLTRATRRETHGRPALVTRPREPRPTSIPASTSLG